MTALELLPSPDTTVRCAEFSAAIGLDPCGTALSVDEIIVVDVPRPWPKPVFVKEGFEEVPAWVDAAGGRGRRVRVLAAVPLDDIDQARVVVHHRPETGSARLERTEHRVDRDRVTDLLRELLTEGLDASRDTEVATAVDQEVLICTQGSHDRCCGSLGSRLVLDLQSVRPELVLRQVSHTGGHRFAPTGVTLPEGRMWGGVTVDEMLAILDRSATPSAIARRSRGWTGADAGPPQVAERAVFELVDDWSFETRARLVEVVADADQVTRVRVATGDRCWEVDVAVGREVPTVACGQPGGLPAKPGLEYRVDSIRAVAP